jgi:hypothetical protein
MNIIGETLSKGHIFAVKLTNVYVMEFKGRIKILGPNKRKMKTESQVELTYQNSL